MTSNLDALRRALARHRPRQIHLPFAVRAAVAAIVAPAPPAAPADLPVAIPGPAGPALLLVCRATRAGDPWSGHIAFPGGRAAPADPDLIATARRETDEELGIDLAHADYIGRLGDVLTTAHRRLAPMIVSPRVFLADPILAHSLCRDRPSREIASSFFVTFADLADPAARTSRPYTALRLPAPAIRLPGRPELLWGLTRQMVRELLQVAAGA